jgi:hypothetical protein
MLDKWLQMLYSALQKGYDTIPVLYNHSEPGIHPGFCLGLCYEVDTII